MSDDKNPDELPPEIERIAAESELSEARRVAKAFTDRVAKRLVAEDPRAVAQAIIRQNRVK